MATIRTAIQITDGMTPAFRSMNSALNMVLSSFEAVQRASSNAIDTTSIQAARAELNKAEMTFNQIEQEIAQADQAQQRLNKDIKNGEGAARGMMGKIKMMVISLTAAFGAKQIIELSDSLTSTRARLDLMNDGLQTTAQLQNMVFQSAQRSRTSYIDTGQAVAKLGIIAKSAFANNKEMVFFAEQMNKQFKIGGASVQEQTAAMYQLTQAMAAGKLQGDEFRSIMENAPMLAQAIAAYTGKSMGELKKMSSEGKITADVIKNAMFATADETNKKFAQIPMTFAQVGTVIGNTMLQTFQPLLNAIGQGAQWIYDNWSTIEPIFWGLTAAVAAYALIMEIQTAVTWLAVAANRALMVAMLSNPIMWIALAIGVIIGMIYKWVQSVGGVRIAWAMLVNFLLFAWDAIKLGFMTGVNAVQTFVGNMTVKVLSLLQDMVNGAIDIINAFISVCNNIPGVAIGTISHVSFATQAAIANETQIAAREANLEQMKTEALTNAQQRQENIKAMQAAKAAEQNDAQLGGIGASSAKTADNTGSMKDSMEATEEELKYLRDLAEMEIINRFTTAEVNVEYTNNNNIASSMDLDGVISAFAESLEETIASVAEGV